MKNNKKQNEKVWKKQTNKIENIKWKIVWKRMQSENFFFRVDDNNNDDKQKHRLGFIYFLWNVGILTCASDLVLWIYLSFIFGFFVYYITWITKKRKSEIARVCVCVFRFLIATSIKLYWIFVTLDFF